MLTRDEDALACPDPSGLLREGTDQALIKTANGPAPCATGAHWCFNPKICDKSEFFFLPVGNGQLFNLTITSPVRYNFALMLLYATPAGFPPSFSHPPANRPQARAAARASDPPGSGGQPLIFDATARSLPSSVSWRHYVHETLKTDIKDEAVNLLKTKGRKCEFLRWQSRYIIENRAVNEN